MRTLLRGTRNFGGHLHHRHHHHRRLCSQAASVTLQRARLDNLQAWQSDHVLRLNHDAIPAVSPMDVSAWDRFVERAPYVVLATTHEAPQPEVAAMLVVLDHHCTWYQSENFEWLSQRYDAFAYVDRIIVGARWRGRGVGAQLYAALDQWVADAPYTDHWLTCEVNTYPPNPGSLAFHKRMGWAELGRSTAYGGTKRVVFMGKSVQPQRQQPSDSPHSSQHHRDTADAHERRVRLQRVKETNVTRSGDASDDESELKRIENEARFTPVHQLIHGDFLARLLPLCGSRRTKVRYRAAKMVTAFPVPRVPAIDAVVASLPSYTLVRSLSNLRSVCVTKGFPLTHHSLLVNAIESDEVKALCVSEPMK